MACKWQGHESAGVHRQRRTYRVRCTSWRQRAAKLRGMCGGQPQPLRRGTRLRGAGKTAPTQRLRVYGSSNEKPKKTGLRGKENHSLTGWERRARVGVGDGRVTAVLGESKVRRGTHVLSCVYSTSIDYILYFNRALRGGRGLSQHTSGKSSLEVKRGQTPKGGVRCGALSLSACRRHVTADTDAPFPLV